MHDQIKNDELAVTLRLMAHHETEQIDRRLSWLGTFQGFLFAALGFSWEKSSALTTVLSLLGITIALLVFMSLIAATFAIQRIRRAWLQKKPSDYTGPDIFGFYPERAPLTVFIAPENLLPLVFIGGWICVLFIK